MATTKKFTCRSCSNQWDVLWDKAKVAEERNHDLFKIDPNAPGAAEAEWKKCSKCGEEQELDVEVVET
jgi:hypothetical protein